MPDKKIPHEILRVISWGIIITIQKYKLSLTQATCFNTFGNFWKITLTLCHLSSSFAVGLDSIARLSTADFIS